MMAAPVQEVCVKWSGKEYTVEGLVVSDTVLDLKNFIQKLTGVRPERQKLLNVKFKGKPAGDSIKISELNLKPKMKIMMMGSTDATVEAANERPPEADDVINDLEVVDIEVAIKDRHEHLAKIQNRVKDYKINVLNEPREGKKLLVLDIDYTLFDHHSPAETGVELMRPYLHEFLTSAYSDYDIVIWSATSMKWIEEKMKILGVSSNTEYKIAFYLDSLAMISVYLENYGVFEVKPLGVIWGKYPQWTEKNTIMFDDVRKNFLMNPTTGLKIRPFKNAHLNRDSDRELLKLRQYLQDISALDDFSTLDHKHWESYSNHCRKRDHSGTSRSKV